MKRVLLFGTLVSLLVVTACSKNSGPLNTDTDLSGSVVNGSGASIISGESIDLSKNASEITMNGEFCFNEIGDICFSVNRIKNTFEITADISQLDPNQEVSKISVTSCDKNFVEDVNVEYFLQKYTRPTVLYRISENLDNLCDEPYVFDFYDESGSLIYNFPIDIENDFFELAKYHYSFLDEIDLVWIENDFFKFLSADGVEIKGPQSSPYQTLFGGDLKLTPTNGLEFVFATDASQLFFEDNYGVQRYIDIPLKSQELGTGFGAILGRTIESMELKDLSEEKYRQLMSEEYPNYEKPASLNSQSSNSDRIKMDYRYEKDDKNVYLDGFVVVGLDVKTAESLGNWYIKDATSVFRGPTKLEGADPDSFESLNQMIGKDKNLVFFTENPQYGIDAASFKILDVEQQYYVDKNSVYKGSQKIEGADPATFEPVYSEERIKLVWKDKNYIYKRGKKIPYSDSQSLELLDYGYAKDKNIVYKDFESIAGADPETFEVLSQFYAKDKFYIYRNGSPEKTLDAASFEILGESYARDVDSLLFQGISSSDFKNLNFANIKELSKNFATDGEFVLYQASILDDADPNSFEVLDNYFSKDKNFVYYEDDKIEGADAKSFERLEGVTYSKDKNFVYCDGKILEGASVKTFKVSGPYNERGYDDENEYYHCFISN